MDNALKAGDLVRILSNEEACGEFIIGGTYPIDWVDIDGDCWIIGEDGDKWPFFREEIMLVSDDEDGGEAWTTP